MTLSSGYVWKTHPQRQGGGGNQIKFCLKGQKAGLPQTMYVKTLPVRLGDSSVPIKVCADDTWKLQSPPCLEEKTTHRCHFFPECWEGEPPCCSRDPGGLSYWRGRNLSAVRPLGGLEKDEGSRAGSEVREHSENLAPPFSLSCTCVSCVDMCGGSGIVTWTSFLALF